MEFIANNLAANKVTLDIKTNSFEETYEYQDKPNYFDNIESVYDMYKSVVSSTRNVPHDRFIYCVLLSLDSTLSLVADKQVFINKFKNDLKEKVKNYEVQLKKCGVTVEDVLKSIDIGEKRNALYYMIGILLNKCVCMEGEDDIMMYEISNNAKDCLLINEKNLVATVVNMETCKAKKFEMRTIFHKRHTTEEKLNTLLVKELKELAEELGLPTTEIENGKKKNLLKGKLKDVIKLKLYS
jgi:hypothetical protein